MSEKTPLVSIIINCYNGEKYLAEAINSIYAQTYKNWEIIFWDNASNDSSATIAKSYDKRLKYYYSNSTTTLSYARFEAVKKAKGKYLSFLDCDDLWQNDKLEKQIEMFLHDSSLAFIYGLTQIIYDDNKKNLTRLDSNIIPENSKLYEGMIFDKLLIEDFIPFPSVLIDKSKLFECGDFPVNFNHSIDYWIFLNLAKKYKVKVLKKICCKYRIHQKNLSNTQLVLCNTENIKLIKSFLPDKRAKNSLKFHYVALAVAYFREKKILKAFLIMCENGGWILLFLRFVRKFLKKT
jgi:glycosyltransferase involved in cell wall biosynthesis